MKKTLLALLLASVIISAIATAAPAVAQSADNGLITCGRGETACTVCDLFTTANRIINFILFSLLTPLGAAMMMYGGAVLLTSGGSQQKKEQGKTILTNTVIGIFIAFAAWAIINTVLGTIANKDKVHLFWEEFPQCAGAATVGQAANDEQGHSRLSPAIPEANPATQTNGGNTQQQVFQTRSETQSAQTFTSHPPASTRREFQLYRELGETDYAERFWETYMRDKQTSDLIAEEAAIFSADELANQLGTYDGYITVGETDRVYTFLTEKAPGEVKSTHLYTRLTTVLSMYRRLETAPNNIVKYHAITTDGTAQHSNIPLTGETNSQP